MGVTGHHPSGNRNNFGYGVSQRSLRGWEDENGVGGTHVIGEHLLKHVDIYLYLSIYKDRSAFHSGAKAKGPEKSMRGNVPLGRIYLKASGIAARGNALSIERGATYQRARVTPILKSAAKKKAQA